MAITSKQLLDALGRTNVSKRVGVGLTAIGNAAQRGTIPASWYEACREMADDAGIECPPWLFKQKGYANPTPTKEAAQ